jgi:hypothetical protein
MDPAPHPTVKKTAPIRVLFGSIFLLWLSSWFILITLIDDTSERGLFGDMFGAVNSLFSGLAFGGVIYAILLQREELQLQREDLSETRRELARSADAQERSERALAAQVRAAAISARLSAVSFMIREEIEHLDVYHANQLGKDRPAALTAGQLETLVAKMNALEAEGKMGPNEQCFRRNCETLKELKTELAELHRVIKEIEI